MKKYRKQSSSGKNMNSRLKTGQKPLSCGKGIFSTREAEYGTAIILVKVKRDLIMEVIEELLKIEGIMEVHSIAGEYDLAVIARVGDNQELSLILADKMCHQMKGITHTKTLISLGAHYNFDEKKVFKKSKNK